MLRTLLAITLAAGSAYAQDLIGGSSGGATGAGGAPPDATYWLGSANGSLSAEIVVNDIASLEAAISAYDFNDAANLTTGDIAAARMATNWGTAGTSACATTGGVMFDNATTVGCDADFTFDGTDISLATGLDIKFGDGDTYFSEVVDDVLELRAQSVRAWRLGSTNMTLAAGVDLDWKNSLSSTLQARISVEPSSATIELKTGASATTLATIGGSQTALFQDATATTGVTSVIVKGGAGQSTTPVFKINDYTDVPIVSIGDEVSSDIAIGYNVGANLTNNTYNVLIGSGVFDNAASNGSNYNVMIGVDAGGLTTGANLVSNVLIGRNAGRAVAGNRNVMLGESAGLASTGSENIMIGRNTGGETTGGSNNIFLGSHAGRDETGSNTLIIDTIDRTNEALGRTGALLYGVMNATASSQTLHMNAAVRATQSLEVGNVGALIYPPSATEPVDCTTSNDGSMYFDTTDQTMCVCANDGADEWQKIQDMTTDCSI